MRVLITSGGTKVPVDRVRDITNKSNGTFGAKIATEFLQRGDTVHLLRAKRSDSPFSTRIDLFRMGLVEAVNRLSCIADLEKSARSRYNESEYTTYTEYSEALQRLCALRWDAIICVAAVSDYLAEYTDSKIRTKEKMVIELKEASKVIGFLKTWSPDALLVGFKMLVDAPHTQLVKEAEASIVKNHCDLVVANNLSSLERGKHEILLVWPTGNYEVHNEDIEKRLVDAIKKIKENACVTTSS